MIGIVSAVERRRNGRDDGRLGVQRGGNTGFRGVEKVRDRKELIVKCGCPGQRFAWEGTLLQRGG